MTDDQKTSFLTYYLRSLAERTRVERNGTKFGFDWVIYNLGLAGNWTPTRLPFLRGGANEISKTKTENEFGVDIAFVSSDKKRLFIFVLKDEVLNSQNWCKHSFDVDLRKASAPDLSGQDLREISEVRVILCYNKDEDQAGVELFDRTTAAIGTKVGDHATLGFERWNLTTITEKVRDTLLTPSLLPQSFFSHFSYLCSQFGDFRHASDEWIKQLIPNWRRFIDELLKNSPDERCVRLLPVALIILREHAGTNKTAETGWIDLMEWAMLAAWRVCRETTNAHVRQAVQQMWNHLYIAEISRYYKSRAEHLIVDFSLDKHTRGGYVDAVASAYVAHWHLARLGILSVALSESDYRDDEQASLERDTGLKSIADLMIDIISANPSTMRPLLDLHHIELFLVWITFRRTGRLQGIFDWLMLLIDRLSARRSGLCELPFLDGRNSIESIFEFVATRERPYEFCDQSSVYLTCLLELCFSLPAEGRDILLKRIFQRLVLGNDDCAQRMQGCEPINLLLWIPPLDWADRVLMKSLANEGDCVVVDIEDKPWSHEKSLDLPDRIDRFVKESRSQREFHFPEYFPVSVIVLACLKHGSPLPPEYWRVQIFGSMIPTDPEH